MGLISRGSSRTYRHRFISKFQIKKNMANTWQNLLLMALLTTSAVAETYVRNDQAPPSGLRINNNETPIELAIIVGSGLGLMVMVFLVMWYFAQEDPSKTNIVYKLSYQRLKTE